jgi:hypothetical protein
MKSQDLKNYFKKQGQERLKKLQLEESENLKKLGLYSRSFSVKETIRILKQLKDTGLITEDEEENEELKENNIENAEATFGIMIQVIKEHLRDEDGKLVFVDGDDEIIEAMKADDVKLIFSKILEVSGINGTVEESAKN